MGYKEYVDDGAGSIPKFGAIFMSNIATKRECLKQRIFGLPIAQADFVKQVKAGMILFLFEFERRQLFGVFRAMSDGKINVMPNAFRSSGKTFPSQVQFTPIWNCSPLCEHEFKDAIRENYYSANKFRFGLSEDQVHRLLLLFSSRKLKKRFPDRQFTRDSRPIRKERRRLDDARILINDRVRLEPDVRDGLDPEILSEYGRCSSDRLTSADHLVHSRGDTRQNKNGLDYDQDRVLQSRAGESRVKRARIDNEDRFLENDVVGKVHYDSYNPRQGTWNDYFEKSLGAGRFLAGHMVNDEGEMNNNLGHIVAREHTHNSFSGVGVANKDRYRNEYRLDIGSRLTSTEHYDDRETVLGDGGNFLVNNFDGKNQLDMDHDHATIDEQQREYQRRRSIDSGTYFLNNRDSFGPDMLTERAGISMGGGTRAIYDLGFPVIEKDLESNIMAEHPSRIARSSTDGGIYPLLGSLKHKHSADDTFGLATSTDCSRFDLVEEDWRIGGGSRFRESDMEENGSQLGSFHGHGNFSTSHLSKSKYTGDPGFQTEISSPLGKAPNSPLLHRPDDDSVSHFLRSISQDATRVVPYDPEVPDICHGHSSSLAVGLGSSPVQDIPFYQGSKVSPSSRMRESSPYQSERRGSGRYFDMPGYGDTHSLPSHHEASYRKINASSMDGYSENREFKTATQEGFGSFYSDSSDHIPPSKVETTENVIDGRLKSSLVSNTKCGYDAGSCGKYNYGADEGTNADVLRSSGVGWGKMLKGASFSEARVLPRKGPIDQNNNFRRSHESKGPYTNNRRVSVFARLASDPEARMHARDDDIGSVGEARDAVANDMDTSVEKVMAMVHHGLSHQVKIRNNKVNHNQQDDEGIGNSKKTITTTSDQEFEHLKLKMKPGVDQTIEKIGGSILEETRHVDFKRRSKAKKNPEGTCNKRSAGVAVSKRPVEDAGIECLEGKAAVGNAKVDGTAVKRRRLVRPVFGKKEPDESISYDIPEHMQSPSRENSLKEKERNLQEANEGCENSNQVADPASKETTEAEKSSEIKSKESSANFQPPSWCPEGEYSKYEPQEAHNSIISHPCENNSKCCGWIEC